jgi:hypothetical protein
MAYNRKLLYTKSFPSWNTPEGNLGSVSVDYAITPIQLVATEINEPGSTITYAVTTGSLPTGLTLSSSGEISGTTTGYSANETVNFTVTATDDEGETAVRGFSFLVLSIYEIDYLLIAGGGGGGVAYSGGGGAGGYRTSYSGAGLEKSGGNTSTEASLLFYPNKQITITVGSGGAGTTVAQNISGESGGNTEISEASITTITAVGGGGGSAYNTAIPGNGGSGGGGGGEEPSFGTGISGQGTNGGPGSTGAIYRGGGGGGAATAGSPGGSSGSGGTGGSGLYSTISGSSVPRAGGGGGGIFNATGLPAGAGGIGGGGAGGYGAGDGIAGSANTGSGGGGAGGVGNGATGTGDGGNGGSGVVILRMPTINYSGTTTGSPTVTTNGSDTILIYTGSGTYTT